MNFKAKIVEVSADEIANALFVDPESNPDQPSVLWFSRDLTIKNSAYYFEVNDQSYGSYGGLVSVQLSRDGLVAELEPRLIKKFGEPDFARIEAALKVNDKTYASIKDVLEKIFANENILAVR